MRRRHRAALLGLPVLVLAACGGGSSSTSSTASAPTPTADTGQSSAQPAASSPAWPTYHRDLARTGNDPRAPRVTRVRPAWSASVDGNVYAEPLVAGGRVIAATENDSLYAFNAATGRRLWRTHLGSPVDGSTLPCGNIDPSGITSTPAIDTRRGVVYAVAFLSPARHELAALDLATGRVRWRRGIDPPGADPKVHQQRSALTLANGRVYVPYGGLDGDCGDYHGWVVSAPAGGPSGALAGFQVPTHREGAIWAPSGAAVDGGGRLFVSTGNGDSTTSFDFGNAVIRLSPSLKRQSFFAPSNAVSLNSTDSDLGSVGPTLLPGGARSPSARRASATCSTRTTSAASATRSPRGRCATRPSAGSPTPAARCTCRARTASSPCGSARAACPSPGAAPASGPAPRSSPGGLVWAIDLDGGRLNGLTTATGRAAFRAGVGSPPQFSTPSESGGRLYVSGGKRVLAFTGS